MADQIMWEHIGNYFVGCTCVDLQGVTEARRRQDLLTSLQVLRSHSSVAVLFKANVSGIAQCCNKFIADHLMI